MDETCSTEWCNEPAGFVTNCHIAWSGDHRVCQSCGDWEMGRLTCPWHGDEAGCATTMEVLT